MNKENAKEFAMQFVKPLTLEDFQEVYGNGVSASENQFGKDFALETALYGSSQADMTNLWKVTRQVVKSLELLNDDHFALGFSTFTSEIAKKFSDNKDDVRAALNTVASQSWQIDKQSVTNFLDKIGYEYPTKKEPLNTINNMNSLTNKRFKY